MRALVTGATGKVGRRLAKRLAAMGHRVRGLVRDPGRADELRSLGIELARGDLADHGSLDRAARDVDVVVHCATSFFPGTETASTEHGRTINELGTRRLAEAARDAGAKRFVFTSTGLIYGDTFGRPAREDDDCAPPGPYFVSKLATERLVLDMSGLDAVVLRLAFVYGDGDGHIEETAEHMRASSPTQRMSIAHHADVARAVVLVLDAPSLAHRIYNVCADEAPDLARLFAAVGAPPPDGRAPDPTRAFDVLLDGRRLREDLGFTPEYPSLRDAIAAGAL